VSAPEELKQRAELLASAIEKAATPCAAGGHKEVPVFVSTLRGWAKRVRELGGAL
jgi:hypothetical protein